MQNYDKNEIINIGYGQDVTILELAQTIKQVVDYSGDLEFDNSRPNGTPQKLLDISRIKSLGWNPKISLANGIDKVYQWYIKQECW